MQVRRLDATPYLSEGETLKLKVEAKNNKLNLIQAIACYVLWLIALAGDCFLIGMSSTLREMVKDHSINTIFLPMVIALLVIHIVPFGFWLGYVLRAKQLGESKWYVITNKRILIIAGLQPVNVTYVNLKDVDSFKINKSSVTVTFGEEHINLSGLQDPMVIANELASIFDEEKQAKEVSTEEVVDGE